MWGLPTPRITTTWRYRVEDPHDMDVISDTFGTVNYSHAYTLGLTQDGFYGKYESARENLLGSRRELRDHDDLLQMVEKHLQMGRERRLKDWGIGK